MRGGRDNDPARRRLAQPEGAAEVANNVKRRRDGAVGADLFISIHHNAGRRTQQLHQRLVPRRRDDNEPDLDVARYLALELGRSMRTQVAKTSPIFSSQLMYDGGFGVLRQVQRAGVLLECSFFSDPDEEQRLRDPIYNLREAYAIYSGCASGRIAAGRRRRCRWWSRPAIR